MHNLFDPGGKRQQLRQSLGQELYTVPEAARVLRMDEKKVRRLIKRGELGHVRPGERTIRVPREAIVDYLAPSPLREFFS